MLYIPAGWWHEVHTPEFTIAFNFWFAPSPRSRFRPTILHLHSDLYAERALAAAAAAGLACDDGVGLACDDAEAGSAVVMDRLREALKSTKKRSAELALNEMMRMLAMVT